MNPFLSRTQKVFVILHLSLIFTLFCARLLTPFVQNHFEVQSQKILLDYLVNTSERQFSELPENLQKQLIQGYSQLESRKTPFWAKLKQGTTSLVIHHSPFFQGWIFLSLAICLALLFHVRGSRWALWLLPVFFICHLSNPSPPGDISHYPSEGTLRKYSEDPSTPLEVLWKRYLIVTTLHEKPSSHPERFIEQSEKAQYSFYLSEFLENRKPDFFFLFRPLTDLFFGVWTGIFLLVVVRKPKRLSK